MNIRTIILIILTFSASVSAQKLSICSSEVFTHEHESASYIAMYSFEVNITNNSSDIQCIGQDIYWCKDTTLYKPDSIPLSNNWYWEWNGEIIPAAEDFYFLSPDFSTLFGRCINPGETIRLYLEPFRPTMDRLWIKKQSEYDTEKDMLLHFFQEAVLHLYHNGENYISTCERTVRYCPEHIECG